MVWSNAASIEKFSQHLGATQRAGFFAASSANLLSDESTLHCGFWVSCFSFGLQSLWCLYLFFFPCLASPQLTPALWIPWSSYSACFLRLPPAFTLLLTFALVLTPHRELKPLEQTTLLLSWVSSPSLLLDLKYFSAFTSLRGWLPSDHPGLFP